MSAREPAAVVRDAILLHCGGEAKKMALAALAVLEQQLAESREATNAECDRGDEAVERALLAEEALRVAGDLLEGEGYDTDVDYHAEWAVIAAALAPFRGSEQTKEG